MRIHRTALLTLLAASLAAGCGQARDFQNSSAHPNAYGCDNCHGYPPPPAFPAWQDQRHPQGVTGPMCAVCHPGTVQADGHTMVPNGEHRDGQVEAVQPPYFPALGCQDCHATPPITGSHVFHVLNKGLACTRCHRGYDPTARTANPDLHMNGTADVVLDPEGTTIETANLPDHSWPSSECSACHAALAD